MPDDAKIIVTILGGCIAVAMVCFWFATKPLVDNPGADAGDDYRDPEHPEDEARRRQI